MTILNHITLEALARLPISEIVALPAAELARLQLRMGIAQTARNAYVGALTASLPAAAQPAEDLAAGAQA